MAATKHVLAVRLDQADVERVELLREALAERVRWRKVGKSDALRVVIDAGLQVEEARLAARRG